MTKAKNKKYFIVKIKNAVEIGVEPLEISCSLKNNLNSKFELRPYQIEVLFEDC